MKTEMKMVCSWCGETMRDGPVPITHSICAACKAGVQVDVRDDSETLSRIEHNDRWWRATQATEAAQLKDQQVRFDRFRRWEREQEFLAIALMTIGWAALGLMILLY